MRLLQFRCKWLVVTNSEIIADSTVYGLSTKGEWKKNVLKRQKEDEGCKRAGYEVKDDIVNPKASLFGVR